MASTDGETPGNGAGGGTTLKFGFAKTAVRAKVAVQVAEKGDSRQLIAGIEGNKIKMLEPDEQREEKKVYVVPKIENTYKTGVGPKKFAPTFKPPEADAPVGGTGEERFEAAAIDSRPVITEYGLEVRARPAGGQHEDQPAASSRPLVSVEQIEEQAYKRDMEILPDQAPIEAYEEMPIEEFGMAMLRGMGWTEGMGVGRNRRTVEPVEYLRRPERLGLGAKPAAPDIDGGRKKVVKMGDKPAVHAKDLVLAPDEDGRVRHVRRLDEKLVHRAELDPGPRPGKDMRVVGGRHEGLACTVVEVLAEEAGRSQRAMVRLQPSNEVVEVRCKDLIDLRQLKQQQQEAGRERERGRDDGGRVRKEQDDRGWDTHPSSSGREQDRASERERGRDGGRDSRDRGHEGTHGRAGSVRDGGRERDRGRGASPPAKRHKGHGSGSEEESEDDVPRPTARSWLAPYIKVRIVDKKLSGGRLYLKKGVVMDVAPGARCDVKMDETRDVVHVSQAQVETVVPKETGAAVLVVSGPLRGNKARLHAKSAAGACAVQMVTDLSVQRLMLDEVASYVGPMDD